MYPASRPKPWHLIIAWLVGVGCLVPPAGTDPTSDAAADASLTDTAANPGDATPSFDAAFPSDASPGADAADPSDASSDAPVDASDGSASDASTCPVGAIDPQTPADLRGRLPISPGAFSCPVETVSAPTASVIRLTRDTHFTLFISHNLIPWRPSHIVKLHRGCDPASSPRVLSAYSGKPETMIVPAGVYTYVRCSGLGSFVAEPAPAPANTNTSCATAATLPSTGVRMYDPNEVRYFKFVAGLGGTFKHTINIRPANAMATGRARFVVRTSCADPTTNFYDTNDHSPFGPVPSSLWTNGPTRYDLPELELSRTYWIVLSEVSPGQLLTLTYDRPL